MSTTLQAHWRALCYLGAAQLFCRRHALRPHALGLTDLKPRIVGHWGALPGVAYALALASAGPRCRVVVGTGHAAAVVRAELWLRGRLDGVGPGHAGADQLCKSFGAPGGALTELDPTWPGLLWTGGELGPALPIAAGAAIEADTPVLVVTGDGELETGVNAAAALGTAELGANVRLCWIVNLNGWRMGGRSRFGQLEASAVAEHLRRLGWQAFVGRGQAGEDLGVLGEALASAAAGRPSVVVIASEKGWTAPARLGGRAFRGSAEAHKLPLRRAEIDEGVLAELVAWLTSYEPAALFDADGAPAHDLARALARPGVLAEPVAAVAPAGRATDVRPTSGEDVCPIDGAITALAGAGAPLLVTSPDELSSNRAGRLATRDGVRVVELLSEEVCAAWLWGWTRSGRRGAFVTYEAFAPLIGSQLAQYGKLLGGGAHAHLPSFVTLQTSLGWHNTPSHANPDLAAVLAARRWPFARAWFPLDAADAAGLTGRALAGNGGLELLTLSKVPMPAYPGARFDLDDGLVVLEPRKRPGGPRIPLLAMGDLAVREACAAAGLLAEAAIDSQVIAVRELTALGSPEARAHATSHARFTGLTGSGRGVAVTTTTALPVAGLLAERRAGDRFTVLGHADAASTTPLGTLLANRCDRWSIAMAALADLDVPPAWGAAWAKERERIWAASCQGGEDEPLPPATGWRVAG